MAYGGRCFQENLLGLFLTASLCVLSGAPVVPVFGFLLAWIATGDLAFGYAQFRSLCWSIVVVPVVLLAAVWEIDRDARNDQDFGKS